MSCSVMPETIFSRASLCPDEVVAGDSVTFRLDLQVGPGYTSGPSRLVFDMSAMLGTSCPNHWVNEASGYTEVYVSNPLVTYGLRVWDLDHEYMVDRDHPPSREAQRMVVLDLSEGLTPGDTIDLHWGENTRGFGPGTKVTTVVPREDHHGLIDVRYFAGGVDGMPDLGHDFRGYTRPRPDATVSLRYRVVPRPLATLRLVRSFQRSLLVPLDRFWNVVPIADADADAVVDADAEGCRTEAGTIAYDAPTVNVRSKGCPLIDSPTMHEVADGLHLFWGDVHSHSVHSIDCIRRARMDMSPAELMDYARDRSGLDFYAVTDHHQPSYPPKFHLTQDQWESTLDDVHSRHRPGEFVVFPGLEFRCPRGDTVVLFNWAPDYACIDRPDWGDIRAVWRDLSDTATMTIPHFHAPGRLPPGTWWSPADPAMEPVLELFSDHGSYERRRVRESGRAHCKPFRDDRCAGWFLGQGRRVGFVANSDDHKGHVGVNGLTAVFAADLTRDAIWEAYRQRRVYATTNARIRLIFRAEGQLMGSIVPNTCPKTFLIDVAAESPLKKVELFRDGCPYRLFPAEGRLFTREVCVEDPAPSAWYARVTQVDNHVAWSSPVWYE